MAKERDMFLALALSFLIFGIGLTYVGYAKRWIIFVAVSFIASFIVGLFIPLPLIPVFWLYGLYDTYVCTKANNSGRPAPKLLFVLDV